MIPLLRTKADAALIEAQKRKNFWNGRIKSQGPWDEANDPLPLTGVPALPMPVEISDEESLRPFFQSLSHDNDEAVKEEILPPRLNAPKIDKEEYYAVDVEVWEKGMLYADGRMDLCKM